MAVDSTASVHWEGDLKSGAGQATFSSGAVGPLDVEWKSRSEGSGANTTPEELIAAAHATCFSMTLSNILGKAGTPPASLDVTATATFVPGTGITAMKLVLTGDVPGVSAEDFAAAANEAKVNCPVSKALAGNVPVTLEIV
jgi:osmotically inducible protein OsmC